MGRYTWAEEVRITIKWYQEIFPDFTESQIRDLVIEFYPELLKKDIDSVLREVY